ncbi:HPr kinase/phosphorylase [Sphingomonas sp.]|uniref:HPr kinase/phosphorylase n=1 Tax=Sphingomonas sp. TaxID=28214 RepID=UPI0025E7F8E5|nr:HPr kinase/phosphatase C-terminal domain-containing protein [Sphingomonas sp.]
MTMGSSETLHASCVAITGRAVLIEGPSGAGKSDLALRLIDRGAVLVSDDYTLTEPIGDRLQASAPSTIAGKFEVRALGIQTMPYADRVPVALLVDIGGIVERMPQENVVRTIAGIAIPTVVLAALEASAPIKVEIALARYGLKLDGARS